MSADFGWILLAALASAGAAAVLLRRGVPRAAGVPLLAAWALLGMHAALLVAVSGAGRVLPGRQLSPGVVAYWRDRLGEGILAQPALLTGALLLALLAGLAGPGRRTLALLAPSTAAFFVLFFVLGTRHGQPPPEHLVALGPGRLAHLTLVPLEGDRTRMIFAEAETGSTMLDVLHVHEAGGRPPRPRVEWTLDGEVVVFMTRRMRLFAVPRDGRAVGWLPATAAQWPAADPADEPVPNRVRLSTARKRVAELVMRHGGIFVPPTIRD